MPIASSEKKMAWKPRPALTAVVLALLLGLPTLRLRADYLAIVTIATAEGLRLVFRSVSATPVTGGTRGLSAFNGSFIDLAPWDT